MIRPSRANSAMQSSSSSSLPLCDGSSCSSSKSLRPQSRGSTTPIARKWLLLAALLFILPWTLYVRTTQRFTSLAKKVNRYQAIKRKTASHLDIKRQLMESLETKRKGLETSNESLLSDLKKTGVLVDNHAENYEALEKREEAMLSRIDGLERHVQENSRLALEENFGKGPYQVELLLRSKAHMRVNTQTLVLETSLDMPHATHHFLRMVSRKLWDGMSFMPQRNASWRIQACPIDMETLDSMDWRFENAKLRNVAFAEHSRDWCGPYSVGFAGSPGGPEFFVNSLSVPRVDASESCFGKIVQGKRVINSIVEKQESAILGIESLRILPSN